jgi:hypothetical protein
MTPKLKELIDGFQSLRSHAMPGEWVPHQSQPDFKNYKEGNLLFCCYAANNITKLAQACKIMAEALENMRGLVDDDYQKTVSDNDEVEYWVSDVNLQMAIDEVQQKVEKVLSEN